jgi:uncharacterized protein YciI
MKQHFFLKLNPARPTFALDMSDDERAIMQQHAAFWRELMQQGRVVVFGPVLDPAGPFGMGIVAAEGEEEIRELISQDPASRLNRYEFHPMRAVLPS